MLVLLNNKTNKMEYHGFIEILDDNIIRIPKNRNIVVTGRYEGYDLYIGIPIDKYSLELIKTNKMSCYICNDNNTVTNIIDTDFIGRIFDFTHTEISFLINTKNEIKAFLNTYSKMVFIEYSEYKKALEI